jgi:hypothetical protein
MPDWFDKGMDILQARKADLHADTVEQNRILQHFRGLLEDKVRESRIDLIRRFVAVAISVGFATILVNMRWLKDGSLPDALEAEQLGRLFTSLIVILLGWAWYHRDIAKLTDISIIRYLLDAIVIIASLIFLASSLYEIQWLFALSVIFGLYVFWDALVLWESPTNATPQEKQGYRRSLGINFISMAYFIGMLFITYYSNAQLTTRAYVSFIFVLGFLGWLWYDGNKSKHGPVFESRFKDWMARILFGSVALILYGLLPSTIGAIAREDQLRITDAQIVRGHLVVAGRTGQRHKPIFIDGKPAAESDRDGFFHATSMDLPDNCVVVATDGVATQMTMIGNCGLRGRDGVPGIPGRDGVPGSPGRDGTPGRDGAPGDSELFDSNTHSAKLCASDDAASTIVIAPKSWDVKACEAFFLALKGPGSQVRVGCMLREEPFVRWREPGALSVSPCGW